MDVKNLSVYYAKFRALKDIFLNIQDKKITAIIGPSGCGKSTLLRSFNRMNDLTPGCRMEGEIILDGADISCTERGCSVRPPPGWDGLPASESFPQVHLR